MVSVRVAKIISSHQRTVLQEGLVLTGFYAEVMWKFSIMKVLITLLTVFIHQITSRSS